MRLTLRSFALACCVLWPVAAPAEERPAAPPAPVAPSAPAPVVERQAQPEKPAYQANTKALPFRKGSFAVHSAQAMKTGSMAFYGALGVPFVSAGAIFGVAERLNVGASVKSMWSLTVGGDAFVLGTLYKEKTQAVALKIEGSYLTLGTGDPRILAFGPGEAGVGSDRGGLSGAYSASTNISVTPQLVYSRRANPGTWFLSGGATLQQFVETPLALQEINALPKRALMPRITAGIERVSSDNLSMHVEGMLGAYLDPNRVEDNAQVEVPELEIVGGVQLGLNLFLP